jgi:hypothetical protein
MSPIKRLLMAETTPSPKNRNPNDHRMANASIMDPIITNQYL